MANNHSHPAGQRRLLAGPLVFINNLHVMISYNRNGIELVLVILIALTQTYGQSFEDHSSSQSSSKNVLLNNIDSVIDFGRALLGKPYKHIAPEGNVLDCSGFVGYVYGHNGIDLPMTSCSLARFSEKIALSEVKKGDLMFFRGGNIESEKVDHVSIVTFVEGDKIDMIHSCQRGIIEENYNNNRYYTSRLLFIGQLPQTSSLDSLLIKSHKTKYDSMTVTPHSLETIKYPIDTIIIKEPQDNNTAQPEPKTIKIIGVGDIMLGTNFPNSSYLPPNDGKYILEPVKEIISKGDVSFGNLEGVILTGKGNVKKCSNPEVCYAFKMPDHYVDYLVETGFNLLSIANNHVRDFGNVGTANTMGVLNEKRIPHAGLEECPYTTFEKEGVTYGFAAFAPNTGTIQINDYANAREIISHLDTISDIVIVSFHGGAEGSRMKHITRKTEMFLGENRGNPYEFSRMAIDAGADVVFGHGPHVTRAIDIYKGRFIAYSLGNFATYGRFNLSGPNGISPIIELNVGIDGRFISGKIYSIKQLGEGGPKIDEQNRALKEIQELTRMDIPECILNILPDGTIIKY